MLLTGLVGHPLGHTLSPRLHAAAFRHAGLDGVYVPYDVPCGNLEAAVRGMQALGLSGCNVTIPHKQAVLALATSFSAEVQAIGAANTLLFRGSDIEAHNTDAPGFLMAWKRTVGRPIEGGKFVILGAGGASRAVVWALKQAGAGRIVVLNRNLKRAEELVRDLAPGIAEVRDLNAASLKEALEDATGLINTTAVGMHPVVDASPVELSASLPSALVVYDVIYNPRKTLLMRQAEDRGAQAVGGLLMLIAQASLSFKLWTGVEPPLEVMLEAV